MAYIPSYEISDVVSIIVDFVGNYFAALVSQAGNLGSVVILSILLSALAGIVGLVWSFTHKMGHSSG